MNSHEKNNILSYEVSQRCTKRSSIPWGTVPSFTQISIIIMQLAKHPLIVTGPALLTLYTTLGIILQQHNSSALQCHCMHTALMVQYLAHLPPFCLWYWHQLIPCQQGTSLHHNSLPQLPSAGERPVEKKATKCDVHHETQNYPHSWLQCTSVTKHVPTGWRTGHQPTLVVGFKPILEGSVVLHLG